jgi:pilus assembly protein CpaB
MDRRFLTVLGLSLMLALIVSMVFFQLVSAKGSTKEKPIATRDVVVAVKALPLGLTVKPEDIKLAKIPEAQFPTGGFSKLEEVVDRPVISNILAEEAVLEGRLAARGSGMGLAPIIPVGMRGVAVRVSDVAGVAGFVLPGLRVDVLVTGRPPGTEGTVTTTCLQNILVLSAGQTIQADANGKAIQSPTVTLLVNPEQAEILTLAGNEGRVQLVLRNSGDQEIHKTPGSELAGLYGGRGVPVPKAPTGEPRPRPKARPAVVQTAAIAPPPPPPPPPEVVVIRGNQRTVEVVASKAN